ncbi:hypothetical protein PTI98_006479 [Pleurotus ostreatus]|nr:hypothetical protein PTI98_006479 [Pleurotus ostreatus]
MDGGVETSSAFLLTFILALACNPACQAKAQSEIDRVIGDHRMPTLEDFEHLHYIRALIKETHRFRTILPCAVPHAVSKDIRYKEYLIPEGTILVMNTSLSMYHLNWSNYSHPSRGDIP